MMPISWGDVKNYFNILYNGLRAARKRATCQEAPPDGDTCALANILSRASARRPSPFLSAAYGGRLVQQHPHPGEHLYHDLLRQGLYPTSTPFLIVNRPALVTENRAVRLST